MRRGNVSSIRHVRHRVTNGTLVIDLGKSMRVLSSAPCGGGLQLTRYIINHQVDANPVSARSASTSLADRVSRHGDPSRYLRVIAAQVGINEACVGLMTAVPMAQLVTGCEAPNGLWLECFATVGVTNAVRAGEPLLSTRERSGPQKVGTINIILITNAALSHSAMVGAVQVVTESKTGVLRDHDVPCWTGEPGATGTGTDAVVIACAARGAGQRVPYSGTHTEIGGMIGRVVAGCVIEGLARAKRWSARVTRHS